ncbi:GGDEF domain-containing protein [Haloimpatiens massiliensis]|uniref:GGDEF domain-containing protein n=1 Tax=Haloimpatiens massiliensis TaxID=1658110 RepID=UPI000C82199C|nr:GGDEF domain-containing protein [Haloimpatiens massiliensis]
MNRVVKKENIIHIMFAYIFLWVFYICTFGENNFYKVLGNNVFLIIGEFVACKVIFNTYRKSSGAEKNFWLFIDLAIISYFIGDLIWIITEIYLGNVLTTCYISEFFYLSQYPLSIIGMLYIVYKKKSKFLTFQMVMDILITVIAIASISWFYIMEPVYSEIGLEILKKISLLANPIGDLGVLLSGLFIILLAREAFPSKVIFLIMWGLLLESFIDLLYCYITFNNIHISLEFLDPFWVISLLFISYSAIVYDDMIQNGEEQVESKIYSREINMLKKFIPYIGVISLVIIIAYKIERVNSIIVGFGICSFLIITRQFFTLIENEKLMNLLIKSNQELDYKRKQLEIINDELYAYNLIKEQEAKTDFLTGLYNRRYVDEKMNLLKKQKKLIESYVVLMIDIDYFKKINDTYGHDVGDKILKEVSNIMKKHSTKDDILVRFGGEEFIFILFNATLDKGQLVAKEIIKEVENKRFNIEKHEVTVTISIGIAASDRDSNKEIQKVIHDADKALYKAKNDGRNCVRIY